MFYPKKLNSFKRNKKLFKFDLFEKCQVRSKNEEELEYHDCVRCYNFRNKGNMLSCGYGVRDLQMPTSTTDLDNEVVVEYAGSEILNIWNFAWFNETGNVIEYYLFYFNDEATLGYENMFWTRPIRLVRKTEYTSTPIGMSYRINGSDYMLFSAADGDVFVFGAGYNTYLSDAPKLMSCCSHDDMLYALTATARPKLVYSDNKNLLEWKNNTTQHIEFTDDRGNPSVVMSFNDYLYVFRDFGITRISTYASSGEFNINHMFQSSSYIYPGSIASDGENVYFLTTDGFYRFDGVNVKKLKLNCREVISDGRNLSAVCFESKYYLACRVDFGDQQKIGCESYENGYINNAIMVYNIENGSVDFLRGVDVKKIIALNNPYKCKVVMCFNNQHIGRMGELVTDGNIFGEKPYSVWESPMSDFGMSNRVKKLEEFSCFATGKFNITIATEKEQRVFAVEPQQKQQTFRCGLAGEKFKVTIESNGNGSISNFNLSMSEQ